MKILFTICFIGLLTISATDIGKQISGTVYDQYNTPIKEVLVGVKNSSMKTITDVNGFYSIEIESEASVLLFSKIGYSTKEVRIGRRNALDVIMILEPEKPLIDQEEDHPMMRKEKLSQGASRGHAAVHMGIQNMEYDFPFNTEEYATIHENGFRKAVDKPLSTFSIDVDAASYSNMRRFINNGQIPPKDAVRIEEMINYFDYDYAEPKGTDSFSINMEIGNAPWNNDHLLVQIGLQGKQIPTRDLPPSNLVFLIDVSGSMSSQNKLPLLKSSLKMLTSQLREEDKVSIVVYAGAAGLVLESTNNQQEILGALDRLNAGGSTAGGAGIKLAYNVAKENYVDGGNNRVIIATDGDFNIGESSNAAMERLIESKRDEGIYLTVLGFGMGNYKDSKMELLADKGNGNYSYIDNIREAKKVLVSEFAGTLFTIAKDVKIQVEFNPENVQAYRLIGYENRKLKDEDFNDDKKDAGELGSGHTVTALYEIIPHGVESKFIKSIDPLRYQQAKNGLMGNFKELLTVKFRYKEPESAESKLITKILENKTGELSQDLGWAAAVAGFGMLLRNSEFIDDFTYNDVMLLAVKTRGQDQKGYRKEFIDLVDVVQRIDVN